VTGGSYGGGHPAQSVSNSPGRRHHASPSPHSQSKCDQQIAIGRIVLIIDSSILIVGSSAGCRLPSPGKEMVGPLSKVALRPFPDSLERVPILIQRRQDQTITLPFRMGNPAINIVYYPAGHLRTRIAAYSLPRNSVATVPAELDSMTRELSLQPKPACWLNIGSLVSSRVPLTND
jgi:hypothetical protein